MVLANSFCFTLPFQQGYSRSGPSQWEKTLHCNVVSHWLSTYTKWSQFSGVNVRNVTKFLVIPSIFSNKHSVFGAVDLCLSWDWLLGAIENLRVGRPAVNVSAHDRNAESVDRISNYSLEQNFIIPITIHHCLKEMTEDELHAPYNHLRCACVIIFPMKHLHWHDKPEVYHESKKHCENMLFRSKIWNIVQWYLRWLLMISLWLKPYGDAPVQCTYTFSIEKHLLRPSDIIWGHRSGSAMAQLMACLTAPSHYLNQSWLLISEVLWL